MISRGIATNKNVNFIGEDRTKLGIQYDNKSLKLRGNGEWVDMVVKCDICGVRTHGLWISKYFLASKNITLHISLCMIIINYYKLFKEKGKYCFKSVHFII